MGRRDACPVAGGGSITPMLLPFVMLCIALDGVEQVWVEWKRMLWGELAMAVREKLRLVVGRAFATRSTS